MNIKNLALLKAQLNGQEEPELDPTNIDDLQELKRRSLSKMGDGI